MYSQRSNGVAGTASMSARNKLSLTAPYKSHDPSLGSLVKVHVTHISNPNRFYVQLDSSTDTLHKLADVIYAKYGEIGPHDLLMKSLATGQACMALFDEDSCWYRAKITGISGDSLVEVFFVDYGNTEFVPPANIKAVTPDLLTLPAQALSCSLAGVSPIQGFWPPEHTAQFEDIASEQSFTACFKAKRKEDHLVKLISESGETINKTFSIKTNSVYLEEDALVVKRQIKIDNSGDNMHVTVKQSKNNEVHMTNCGDHESKLPILKLTLSEFYDVTVIFSQSPSQFWCQPVKFCQNLEFITKRLGDIYDKMPQDVNMLRNPRPGMICAAKFTEDNLWYRASILSIDSNSANVFFMDFGNSEIVSTSLLKNLSPELHDLPAQAVECMLGNVRSADVDWSDAALEEFEVMIYDKEMEIKVIDIKNTVYIVTLIDSIERTDTGVKLIQANLASPSQISLSVCPYRKLDIPVPSQTPVFLSWAENPEFFWVQLVKNQETLEEMTETLQNYCVSDGTVVVGTTPGSPVLAKFSEDKAWYRGIVQLLTGSEATIFFVDFGNTDSIPFSSLLKVPPVYLKTPSFAVLCKLENIQPLQTSWMIDAKCLLEEFMSDGANCRFLRKDGEALIVELFKGDENIEDKLVTAGVARKKYRKIKSEISSTSNGNSGFPSSVSVVAKQQAQIFVSHVDSINKFWCQLSKFVPDLDKLMENMEAFYEKDQGQKLTPATGSPCAAKYSADDAWYRAKILTFDERAVEVFFVDYGNCDIIPPSDICQLTPKFSSFPTQAIHCQFAIENTEHSLSDKFSKIVENKELVLKVESVSNDIHTVDLLDDNKLISTILTNTALPRVPVLPLPRVQFRSTTVPIGKPIQAFVSYILSPGKLYLQLAGIEGQLTDITTKLKSYCSSSGIIPDIREGDGCAALFAEDGEWYRAKVMNICGSEVKVLFVDYGNSEHLQKDDLRPLPPEVTDIPPFGIECSLDDLAPIDGSDWSVKATSLLESFALDQELNCGFVSSAAAMITVGGEELGDKLINAGFARRVSAPPIPKNFKYPVKPTNEVKGYITHIEADGIFYVQLSSTEQDIIKLAKLMQTEGNLASKLSSSVKIDKGLACCAKFNVDKNWYRVHIEIVDGVNVMIRFVDYGNCDDVRTSELREITLGMMTASVQAFPCKLKDLTEWNPEFHERLNAMTEEISLNFISDERPFIVEAKTKRGYDIADLIMNPPRPRVYAKQVKPVEDVTGYICCVESDNTFYIRLSMHKDAINELSNKLAEFTVQEVPEKLSPGYACAAKSCQDDAWRRASVIKVGTMVCVNFVDFGNGDTIPVGKLKEQPEDMLDIPPYAFRCTLDGIQNWTLAAKDLLDAYTKKEMKVRFLSDSSPYMVKLFCEEREMSRILLRADVKLYPQQLTNSQMTEGAVCHMEDDGRFYVHLNKDKSILDNISADLQDYYGSDVSEVAYDLEKGQPCCALFSEDGFWYRACVEEIKDRIQVRFVDFGNSELVDSADVKFMEKTFNQHPPMAYECQLKNAGKWTEEKQKKFTAMTKSKNLNIQFVTNTAPYLIDITRSLADVLQDGVDQILNEENKQEAEILRDYPPQSPLTADQCYISHVDLSGKFYIQTVSEEEKLSLLSEQLQTTYSDSSETLLDVDVGSVCVAKFTEDDMWYRAIVEEVEGQKFKVRFVDYGNTDTVKVDRIKKQNSIDFCVPPLAYRCSLYGLSDWTAETIALFENSTNEKCLSVKCFTTDPEFSVELTTEDGSDILFMIAGEKPKESEREAEHPTVESEISTENESREADNVESESSEKQEPAVAEDETVSLDLNEGCLSEAKENESSEKKATKVECISVALKSTPGPNGEKQLAEEDISYKVDKLSEGSRLSVLVSHSISPSDFYVQQEKSRNALQKLMAEMFDYYNSLTEGEGRVMTPSVNEPVAVLYSEDESWYRCRVEAVSDDKYEVFYVDYGNVELVSMEMIRQLQPMFCDLPIQAVECSLAGIQSSGDSWSEEATKEFVELTNNKSILADVIKVGEDGNCLVNMMHMGISISQPLIDKHYGSIVDTPVSISKKIKRVFSDSQSPAKRIKMADLTDSVLEDEEEFEDAQILRCISEELHSREKIHATVCQIETPSKFWCHLTFAADALKTQMEVLQTAYSQNDNETCDLSDLSTGDIGVVQSSDSKYYRTSIVDSDDKLLNVRLVDFGRCEKVVKEDFLVLKDKFYAFPSQAVRCSLHRIVATSDKWDEASCSKFSDLVSDRELVLVVRRKMCNTLSVDLFDNEDSISQSLLNDDLAVNDEPFLSSEEDEIDKFGDDLPEIIISEDSITQSNRIDYSDLDIDSEYELCIDWVTVMPTLFNAKIVFEKKVKDQMGDITNKMESGEIDCDWFPEKGRPCLGLNDGEWCRARIVNIVHDKVKVYLVDSGKSEEINTKNICPIPQEYLSIPTQFITCCLGEILPVDDEWSEEAIQYIKDYIKDKKISGYITSKSADDLYHVTLADASDIDSTMLNRLLVDLGFAIVIPESQLEVQLQMEEALNDTDKMEELEASFQDVSFLRENSLDENVGGEIDGLDETCQTFDTTGHSICLQDTTGHSIDLTCELAERSVIDDAGETPTNDINHSKPPPSRIEESLVKREAQQEEAEEFYEAEEDQYNVSEVAEEDKENENQSVESIKEAVDNESEIVDNESEAVDNESEAVDNESEAVSKVHNEAVECDNFVESDTESGGNQAEVMKSVDEEMFKACTEETGDSYEETESQKDSVEATELENQTHKNKNDAEEHDPSFKENESETDESLKGSKENESETDESLKSSKENENGDKN